MTTSSISRDAKIPTPDDITSSIKNNRTLLNDNNKNDKLELPDAYFTFQNNYPKLATTPLTLKYWEMQRTDSGQSVIRVTTDSTTLQIARRNELYHFTSAENRSTTTDDNSASGSLNSDSNRIEFTNLKEKSLLSPPTNPPAISVNSILAKNELISDDNLETTTTSAETIFITSLNLFSTALTSEESQKTRSSPAKINLAEDNIDFDSVETTSTRSFKLMQTTGVEDLTFNMEETNFLFENLPSPLEIERSSVSTFHLQTLPVPSSSSSSLSSSSLSSATTKTTVVIDDDGLMEFLPLTDKLLSNDNGEENQLKSGNNEESEITNSENFYQKTPVVSQNVEFDELNEKETEINLIHNQNEQWQPEKERTLTDSISTASLPSSDPSSGPVELSSILGNQIDSAFSNLFHLEKEQMGISIPKYENSATGVILAQIPKQNGVNTVMINTAGDTTNTDISIKRGIMKGEILEKQKSFIAGKPVTLELWNPIIYGKDLFINGFQND
ncbi:hypothetical protein LOAG_03980 [Loa loa]|uniref:PDZ domain-containing protein n=1 Tax=Loa loa TaxID=7209 RepID=A0A1I7VSD5_LOALO|nr:hypothetical protein LOAG_03980 [Loa loa]EFO24510.2 hypothetical protein LOAG_03980 [Loa loa]